MPLQALDAGLMASPLVEWLLDLLKLLLGLPFPHIPPYSIVPQTEITTMARHQQAVVVGRELSLAGSERQIQRLARLGRLPDVPEVDQAVQL